MSSKEKCKWRLHLGIILLLGATASSSSLGNYGSSTDAPTPAEISQAVGNNGALQLIVQAYVDSILRDLQNDGGTIRLEPIVEIIREKMKELPRHLRHHPALMETRLWIGSSEPTFDPYRFRQLQSNTGDGDDDDDDAIIMTSAADNRVVSRSEKKKKKDGGARLLSKRTRNALLAEEICSTDRQWELINRTTDVPGHSVEIIQTDEYKQYVFVYRCVAERGPCLGISPLYNSECEMRPGWVNMYHRRTDVEDAAPQWGYVAMPHHCACKITPKFITDK